MNDIAMYGEIADWFHLLTAPAEYAEEALEIAVTFDTLARRPVKTLLELGSGGGNNASYLKKRYETTLVDRSVSMLETSRTINPELEHVEADMRTVRLGRTFDAVLIHDAVMHLTPRGDLASAIQTAAVHCSPGGVAMFIPDDTTETFEPMTISGGHDGDGRSMRYLEWRHEPDPESESFLVTFAYVLRENGKPVRVLHEEFEMGLFSTDTWLEAIAGAGLTPRLLASSERTPGGQPRPTFAGLRE